MLQNLNLTTSKTVFKSWKNVVFDDENVKFTPWECQTILDVMYEPSKLKNTKKGAFQGQK